MEQFPASSALGFASAVNVWQACDVFTNHVAFTHENIGASPAALASLRRFAKSRPRDAIERARFRAAAIRERKAGSTEGNIEHAGSFSDTPEAGRR